MTTATDGVLGLYSAVGDALAGRPLGFGLRRASLASRFAAHRGVDTDGVAAAWVAGALADVGLLGVVVPPEASERLRGLAEADAPLLGARFVDSIPGLPARAADTIRWHREYDDGTGIPDGLRWDGVPTEAAALGIAHAFLDAIEDPREPRQPAEALYAIIGESGRRFRVELVRQFREYIGARVDWSEPLLPELAPLEEGLLLEELCVRLDARDSRTRGRSERRAQLAQTLAQRLDLDVSQAVRTARLLSLGRAAADAGHDDFDPLSRFAREHRILEAKRAAAIAAAAPGYADDAAHLASSAAWYEDGGVEPLAGILGLAIAVESLPPIDAPRRIAAASGTQFHPAVARAYLAFLGAPT
ncbi:MAG TPA: HD domain-containing phosphohydrolase [Candidatus Sulfotelmatobacter sp.]|nr:HD domain-containing phosphohydrolase [Candidatus Sulfotelmatobacter sp.]